VGPAAFGARPAAEISAAPSARRVIGRRAGEMSATVLPSDGRTICRATIPLPDIPARTTLYGNYGVTIAFRHQLQARADGVDLQHHPQFDPAP